MSSPVPSVNGACPYVSGDSLKRKKMSIDEKRRIVHRLSKDSDSAVDALQKWSREELLQVLCVESGEKGSSCKLGKDQIINMLLKVVSENNDSIATAERDLKRQRKGPNPYVSPTNFDASASTSSLKTKGKDEVFCKNLSCQAVWRREDMFCKRCTCCLCHKYDENKDPSLWLTCDSETCGLSCHLECAFETEKSGLKGNEPSPDTDGCFFCVACGKTNSLLECWRKQLLMVRETERVEVLCSRLVLAQKLLKGTEKYKKLSETVEEAVKSLETELGGPLTDRPSTMCRGSVNKLTSAPKVKDLCSYALNFLLDTPLDVHALPVQMQGTTKIRFEDVDVTSLTLVLGTEEGSSSQANIIHYIVWHRKVSEKDYTDKVTCALVYPMTRFVVSGLTPATEYCFKVVSFSGVKELSVEETKVSTKPSQEAEEETPSATEEDTQLVLQETVPEKPDNNGKSSSNGGFELADFVRVVRELELSGYVGKIFRKKFLTWYALEANAEKKKIVEVWVNNLKTHPEDLADQLIHTFSGLIAR